MSTTQLIEILGLLTTGLFGWLIGRRRNVAIAQEKELDNVQHAIKIWRELSTDLTTQVRSLSTQVTWLKSELDTVLAENKSLRLKVQSLEKQIAKI